MALLAAEFLLVNVVAPVPMGATVVFSKVQFAEAAPEKHKPAISEAHLIRVFVAFILCAVRE